ncbi:MAG: cbb3-type cytochrome c oxidase subunit II [Verrucomicrobiota bacterium]
MSFRTFFLSLSASFGVAWLAIVIVPYFKMRSLEPVSMGEDATGTNAIYIPKRAGRIADGSKVYAANGCYLCHTQLIRPDYAGNDVFRTDYAGFVGIVDDIPVDNRRETNAFDYPFEKFAHIGINRIGPDLSNIAVRIEKAYANGGSAEQWLYRYLYNPRHEPARSHSTCPSFRFLFDEKKITGNPSDEALPFHGDDGKEIVPNADGRALVSYLLSLKKDNPVPAVFDFKPADESSTKPAAATPAP